MKRLALLLALPLVLLGCSDVALPTQPSVAGAPHLSESYVLAADFYFSCEGLTCSFYDQSSPHGAAEAYTWEFDFFGGSNDRDPVYQFPFAGDFLVTLRVYDAAGNPSVAATKSVRVSSISANAVWVKERTASGVRVSWQGASGGVHVLRDGLQIASVSSASGDYLDTSRLAKRTVYGYQVCEVSGGACSDVVYVRVP